jgi:hypothetical protein
VRLPISNVAIDSPFLFGYEEGHRIKLTILEQLSSMPEHSTLIVDFANVQFIDVTCAEELIVGCLKIARENNSGNRFLVLEHLADQHKENIHTALTLAKQAILAKTGESWRVLGHIPEGLFESLNFVIAHGRVLAHDLATELELSSVSLATQKLYVLHQFRLLDRKPAQSASETRPLLYEYFSLV